MALAPTTTATDVLIRATSVGPITVAKLLASDPAPCDGDRKPEVNLGNEASMFGARDGEALLARTRPRAPGSC